MYQREREKDDYSKNKNINDYKSMMKRRENNNKKFSELWYRLTPQLLTMPVISSDERVRKSNETL